MTDAHASLSAGGTTVADVLLAMGQLMSDCHRECLALQDAISQTLPATGAEPRHATTMQNLDHMTQVHEDLARLLPELADAISRDVGPVNGLAEALRLMSLRHRLFGYEPNSPPASHNPGEVSLF